VLDFVAIQRILNRWFVKVQSRMEAGIADRWIPAFASAVFIVVLSRFALLNYDSFSIGVNVSRYAQVLNSIAEGNGSDTSLFNLDVGIWQLHFSLILYPLALLAIFIEPVPLLLILQSVAIGSAVVPLWSFARQVAMLRISASTAIVAAYILHPMVHDLAVTDFHPETLALPFFIALAYFGATKKWVFYWVCVALILLIRADLGLVIGFWGFLLLRNDFAKQGMRTLSVGFVWSLGILLIVQPLLELDVFQWSNSITIRSNAELFVALLAPLIFLPVISVKYFLPAVPLTILYLVSDGVLEFGDPRPFLIAFAMIAATYALASLGDLGVNRVFTDVRILTAFLAASFLIFVSSSVLSPYERPWNWGEKDATAFTISSAVDLVPQDAAIRASQSALPELVNRPNVFELQGDTQPSAVAAVSEDTKAVLIVQRDLENSTVQEKKSFDAQIATLGFQLIVDEAGVLLYVAE